VSASKLHACRIVLAWLVLLLKVVLLAVVLAVLLAVLLAMTAVLGMSKKGRSHSGAPPQRHRLPLCNAEVHMWDSNIET
jgi:hypothetical protein